MSIRKEELIPKEDLDNIWKLSKKSFKDDDALEKLREIERDLIKKLSKCIIIYINSHNQDTNTSEYYSFYRICSQKGTYLFSLPGRLNLPESQWKQIAVEITEPSKNPAMSRNGGDYNSGYRIYKLTHPKCELYKVLYSWALMSDFEDQCSDKPEIYNSYQELVESTGINLHIIDI